MLWFAVAMDRSYSLLAWKHKRSECWGLVESRWSYVPYCIEWTAKYWNALMRAELPGVWCVCCLVTHSHCCLFFSVIACFYIGFLFCFPTTDFQQDEPVERDTEAIKEEAEKWVSRCKTGASVVMSCWIGWIIAVQLLRGLLPSSFFMLTADDSASTGW